MTLQLGIALAFVCAVATNLGFLYKHRGANLAPKVDVRHPLRSAKGLFQSKWFAIGMGVAIVAWLFHVAAMALAPISVVQAVLSGGVVILAVMAERFFGYHVGPRQWWGVGLTAGGLILIGATLPGGAGAHSTYSLTALIAFEGGMVGLGVLLIMGPRVGAPGHHHGLMLGAAAGVLFGVSDVSIKAVTGLWGIQGAMALVSPWLFLALAGSVVAFYASARSLQEGDAVPIIAVTGAAANVSTIAGGIIVFGDPMPGSAFGVIVQVLAFSMVVVAAIIIPAPVRAAEGAPASA